MSYLENGYCDVQEYNKGQNARLEPNELFVDELYLLMIALNTSDPAHQALKKPTRVLDTRPTGNGLYYVRLVVLNSDLQEELETIGVFESGYWRDAPDKICFGNDSPKTGYLKGYEDDFDLEFERLKTDLLIPANVSI